MEKAADVGTLETKMTQLGDLVKLLSGETLRLPEIQRPYVWNRPQVRDLLDSLYQGYPVGTMLIWQTDEEPLTKRVDGVTERAGFAGTGGYLLDGQQRLTALMRAIHTGDIVILFNLETEEFAVANAVLAKDSRWVRVIDIFKEGVVSILSTRMLLTDPNVKIYSERLDRVNQIGKTFVPVNVLSDFSYEEVTEIFVRVNSKGTRLKEADLAIAQLSFRLPGMVTKELGAFKQELDDRGWEIELPLLVRLLTVVATSQSKLKALRDVEDGALRAGWAKVRSALELLLNYLDKNLGIESAEWLPSVNTLAVPVAYLAKTSSKDVDVNGMLRWFLLANTWGRYSQASETALDQDLKALDAADPFFVLTDRLRQVTGRLEVTDRDLDDAARQSPFFLMAYLACRKAGASDWWTGAKLSSTNLGTANLLHIHHIFPQALVSPTFPRVDVNEIANLAFLSQQANLAIGKKDPTTYLSLIDEDRLRTQFIPMDAELWVKDRFQDFLKARRKLLAAGMNDVVTGLEQS